ncbi:MAG: hypothetical protein GY948_05550, partial [Alphaproteobacteria bacterium]|nr:hypothetical protein [Alphaproteobacteria bacterium]
MVACLWCCESVLSKPISTGCAAFFNFHTPVLVIALSPRHPYRPLRIAPLKPELLAPAGTLKSLRYAFAYGADAVYAGQPRYSLRARNNEFTLETIQAGIEYAHDLGKHFYLASNLIAHNAKVKSYARDMEPVIALGPDALILSDPGLIMLVRERWPEQT